MSDEASDASDAILDHYAIENLEQLRVLSDQLRLSILTLVTSRPMTVTQVAEVLGQAPAKVHYHMRELERVGLVRIVDTREKGGILEKYYRAIARSLDTPPSLFRQSTGESIADIGRGILLERVEAFVRAMRHLQRAIQAGDEGAAAAVGTTTFLNLRDLWLTREEIGPLMERIDALLEPHDAPRGLPGERNYAFTMLGNDAEAGAALPEHAQRASDVVSASPKPKTRHVVVVGTASYIRADLEQWVAHGERHDLYVLGHVEFARDVTPDLVRRAFARFRCLGTVDAPDDVRAVLRQLGESTSEKPVGPGGPTGPNEPRGGS